MSILTKVGTTNKLVLTPSFKIAGAWKAGIGGWVKEQGVWKNLLNAPPFVLSGSWETGMEGWTHSQGAVPTQVLAQTGTYSFDFQTAGPYLEYSLPSSVVSGLKIGLQVYGRASSGSHIWRMQYSYGSDAFQEFGTNQNTMTGWQVFSSVIPPIASGPLRIRLLTGSNIRTFFDDWSITGTAQ